MGAPIESRWWVTASLVACLGCREGRSLSAPSAAPVPTAAVAPSDPTDPPERPDDPDDPVVEAPSWTRSLVPVRTSDPGALVGRLSHRHTSEILDFYDPDTGERRSHLERVTDFLRLCPEPSGELEFFLFVEVINFHTCEVAGKLRRDAAGTLVLVLDQREHFVPPPEESERFCYLRLEREGDSIRIAELWPSECELSTCGARAHPFGVFELRTLDRRDCRRPFRPPSE